MHMQLMVWLRMFWSVVIKGFKGIKVGIKGLLAYKMVQAAGVPWLLTSSSPNSSAPPSRLLQCSSVCDASPCWSLMPCGVLLPPSWVTVEELIRLQEEEGEKRL